METKSSKSRKTHIFPKGFTHSFGPKFTIFPIFFFHNKGHENVFYDILNRKNAFLGHKNKKFTKSKNWHFSKGVNPWFWAKNGRFSRVYFLGNIGQENLLLRYSRRKNVFLGYKNKKLKKSKNWNFSKGVNPWFLYKKAFFSKFFFLRNMGQENVFYDFLEGKNAFQRNKNKKFKKPKNWHYSKKVNPWFCSKNGQFANFFF